MNDFFFSVHFRMLHRLGTRPVTRLLLLSSLRGSSVRGSLRTAMAMPSPPVLRVTTTEESSSAAERLCEALGFATQVTREEIHSFYWWEGAVQSEPEVRVSFETSEPFESVLRAVEAAHSYDVPMILADTSDKGAAHWKGVIRPLDGGAKALAERLAASRLVACAQARLSLTALRRLTDTSQASRAPLRAIQRAPSPHRAGGSGRLNRRQDGRLRQAGRREGCGGGGRRRGGVVSRHGQRGLPPLAGGGVRRRAALRRRCGRARGAVRADRKGLSPLEARRRVLVAACLETSTRRPRHVRDVSRKARTRRRGRAAAGGAFSSGRHTWSAVSRDAARDAAEMRPRKRPRCSSASRCGQERTAASVGSMLAAGGGGAAELQAALGTAAGACQ